MLQSGGQSLPMGTSHSRFGLVAFAAFSASANCAVRILGKLGRVKQTIHQHSRSRHDFTAGLHLVLRFGQTRRVDENRRRSFAANARGKPAVIRPDVFLFARRVRQIENCARRPERGDFLWHQENIGGRRADGAFDFRRASRLGNYFAADYDLSLAAIVHLRLARRTLGATRRST